MKKVHLICNAHIDPIWQWDWQEGASAVLSTFQSAVNLAEKHDYIFCHNEVTVYKYVEEFAGAGATVPLIGFGALLADGTKTAIQRDGLLGILTGPLTAGSAGIMTAVLCGIVASFFGKPKAK